MAISPGSFQHFTIFVIELMEVTPMMMITMIMIMIEIILLFFQGNKALYKPCATWRGEFEETVAVFLCNDGDGHRWVIVVVFLVALLSALQSGAHRKSANRDFQPNPLIDLNIIACIYRSFKPVSGSTYLIFVTDTRCPWRKNLSCGEISNFCT